MWFFFIWSWPAVNMSALRIRGKKSLPLTCTYPNTVSNRDIEMAQGCLLYLVCTQHLWLPNGHQSETSKTKMAALIEIKLETVIVKVLAWSQPMVSSQRWHRGSSLFNSLLAKLNTLLLLASNCAIWGEEGQIKDLRNRFLPLRWNEEMYLFNRSTFCEEALNSMLEWPVKAG